MCHLDSVFHNTTCLLHNFTWEAVWDELSSKAPTLLRFYRHMFCVASKQLICFAISMILKWRSDGMGLVHQDTADVSHCESSDDKDGRQ